MPAPLVGGEVWGRDDRRRTPESPGELHTHTQARVSLVAAHAAAAAAADERATLGCVCSSAVSRR